MAASGTSIEMATQRRSTTVLDGPKGLELLIIETASIPVQEATTLRAEEVGHLHGRSLQVFLR